MPPKPGPPVPTPDADRLRSLYATDPGGFDRLAAELTVRGYTLAAIGAPVGLTRARVQQRVAGVDPSELPAGLTPDPLPAVPEPAPAPAAEPVPEAVLSDADAEELRRLRPLALAYRRQHADDHPAAVASRQLDDLLASLHRAGFAARQLADVLGVTKAVVLRRVWRAAERQPAGR